MTKDEMLDLFNLGGFSGDVGRFVQYVARKYPKDLELCYEVAAEIRGRR